MHRSTDSLSLDLYTLTMLQGYLATGMTQTGVFEFFVRELPDQRNFLIAAGVQQLLDDLVEFQFTNADIEWLSKQGQFNEELIEWLQAFQFTGDVHAMREGTAFFQNEPILRVTASLPQAQLVESLVINRLQFQTLIASKAVRYALAAPQKQLVDFGLRRAHGLEAGLFAARASFLAGFSGTSNVRAGKDFGIPTFGTMAHSFVEAHNSENEAFTQFALANPESVVLLIDTYSTHRAALRIPELAKALQQRGILITGVRIDSGDLAAQAREVRDILDAEGLKSIRILVSGNLDEFKIRDLIKNGAPIDGFGVGTDLCTSADTPALNCAYKLQEYDGKPRRKLSENKSTWPGVKQVFRESDDDGIMVRDTVTAGKDRNPPGAPLLKHCMAKGQRIALRPTLHEVQNYTRSQIDEIPLSLRGLNTAHTYRVEIAEPLKALAAQVDADHAKHRVSCRQDSLPDRLVSAQRERSEHRLAEARS